MNEVETISHLVIQCSAALERCRLVDWFSPSVEECIRQWFQKKELTEDRAIPCLILWGIWLAHDVHLFENKQVPTFQVVAQVCAIFQGCRKGSKERISRQVGELQIDRSIPCGFFDGGLSGPRIF
jgi:hypothetical protein